MDQIFGLRLFHELFLKASKVGRQIEKERILDNRLIVPRLFQGKSWKEIECLVTFVAKTSGISDRN